MDVVFFQISVIDILPPSIVTISQPHTDQTNQDNVKNPEQLKLSRTGITDPFSLFTHTQHKMAQIRTFSL